MITNRGKKLLTNSMLGSIPTFATHIAIGCGSKPLTDALPTQDAGNAALESLAFEMTRAPIVSRGIIYEDGIRKLALKAELPIEHRYSITEVGLFSGARNLKATQFDSKTIVTFNAPLESWFITTQTTSVSALPIITSSISPSLNGDISLLLNNVVQPMASIANDNEIWTRYSDRKTRFEPPRFMNNSIIVSGDWSYLVTTDGVTWNTSNSASARGIETSSIGVNLAKNSGVDQIRLAFSVVAKSLLTTALPTRTNIWIEFVNNYSQTTKKYAIAKKSILAAEFGSSNYHVLTIPLSDFVEDSGFSWSAVNGIRIRTSLQVTSTPSSNYYIVYDGLRLENISTENPTYGLFAYTQITTSDGQPALKTESTNNFIEFRMEVQ